MCNHRPAWSVLFCLVGILAIVSGAITACGGSESESDASTTPEAAQRSDATVKIMPLGDSITVSTTPHNSYRYRLWHLLVDHGYRVDFVGSQHGVGNGPPANPDFDMDHEGHAGWRADQILSNIQGWASAATPDVVLLHLGTNDVCQKQSVASTVTDISRIIDVLRKVNPRIRVLLAQLINSSNCPPQALNASLPALVDEKNSTESPIVVVDQYSGFNPATMCYDGTHPNDIGDTHMADRWFEKLATTLDAFLTTTALEVTP